MQLTTARRRIVMDWVTPPAQVASDTVGQFCPAHLGGSEDLHSAHQPKRTRVAWDCNRDGCSVPHFAATRPHHAVLGEGSDGADAITTAVYKGHLITVIHRFVNGAGAGGCLLVGCSQSRGRRRRRSDIERSSQKQSVIQKLPRCCRTDNRK